MLAFLYCKTVLETIKYNVMWNMGSSISRANETENVQGWVADDN